VDAATLAAVDVETWLWAYFMVTSRAFDCQLPRGEGGEVTSSKHFTSGREELGLVPIVDLANAAPLSTNDNTMVLTMPDKVAFYSVRAPKALKRGSEVLQNYAGTPRALSPTQHYLFMYGFVDRNLDNSIGDFVTVEMHRDGQSTPTDADVWVINADGVVPEGFVRAAGGDTGTVLAAISQAAESALHDAPSTLDEDMTAMRTGRLSHWLHAALLFRIRWKRIVQKLVTTKGSTTNVASLPQRPRNVHTVTRMKATSMYRLVIETIY